MNTCLMHDVRLEEQMKDKNLYDSEGFWRHCEVVEKLIQLGVDPHTRHHINQGIREASNKVHNGTTSDTKKGAHYMSEEAGTLIRAGQCEELVIDHVVPVSVITEMIFNLPKQTLDDIGSLIRDWTILAVVTRDQHEDLRRAKLYNRMPVGWNKNDGKLARYDHIGIRLVENEYGKLC